jgi:hypothetical protein
LGDSMFIRQKGKPSFSRHKTRHQRSNEALACKAVAKSGIFAPANLDCDGKLCCYGPKNSPFAKGSSVGSLKYYGLTH